MKPISLDDMRERIGRAIFGNDWLGGVSDQDWALIKGPYGIKRHYRSGPGATHVLAIERCPPAITAKLDQAIGRAARADAQYSTVDTWIEEHDLPVDPTQPADRTAFNALMRKEFAAESRPAAAQRGPKPKVLPRLLAAIEADVADGRLTVDQLRALPLKEGGPRYSAKISSFRDARARFLSGLEAPQNNSKQLRKKTNRETV